MTESVAEEKSTTPLVAPVTDKENAGDAGNSPSPPHISHEEAEMSTVRTATKSRRHSRVLSGPQLSPLKILQERAQRLEGDGGNPSIAQTQRRALSPEKRFPVRVSAQPSQDDTLRARPKAVEEKQMSIEEALKENEGLKHAIDIFEDDAATVSDTADNEHTAEMQLQEEEAAASEDNEPACGDDTMVSTFSTFSAVPNLTMFARLGTSPTKAAAAVLSPDRTPRAGPLPNRGPAAYEPASDNTTSLLNFTEQLRFPGGGDPLSPAKSSRMSPHRTAGEQQQATPQGKKPQQQNGLVNLLDFDMPPLPTPRSMPTITARELESLKSGFLSEISSLRASLSGKAAETASLKTAVGDAEKRVGECLEQLREEKAQREQAEAEREGWERRGREMESVLRSAREEIVCGQREREELEARLDEADKRREAAEVMAQEAESKMAGMRAVSASVSASAVSPEKTKGGVASPGSSTSAASSTNSSSSSKDVEAAVERVARELHALYKSKHETKVAALKKSYEGRWEKRVRELEARLEALGRENDELRVGRDATLTRVAVVDAAARSAEQAREEHRERDAAHIKELRAEVDQLQAVVGSVRDDNGELRRLLERERVEKGELVQLAEEMMAMQQQQSFLASDGRLAGPSVSGAAAAAVAVAAAAGSMTPSRSAASAMPGSTQQQPRRRSSSNGGARPSGLKLPAAGAAAASGAGASRIGRVGAGHERAKSTGLGLGSGVPAPGAVGLRSGIMSSIEKMGSYRGRGGE